MKVLVATAETQGRRDNDFCFATPGELVNFPFVCDRDQREGPDGGCGCMRAMAGLMSGKGTTTVMVVEREDMTIERLAGEIAESQRVMHWGPLLKGEIDDLAQGEARVLAEIAAEFEVGDVLEKRGVDVFQKRR